MGTCSYVLTGTDQAMKETFGSTCHGAVSISERFLFIKLSNDTYTKSKLPLGSSFI